MKMPIEKIDMIMFAPCGMNCKVCYKHCYHKRPCAGCLNSDKGKPEHCRKCKIISPDERSEIVLADKIKVIIQERFELDIPVFVISQEELKDLLSEAPVWWGNDDKEMYDNLIFVMFPAIAEIIAEKIGKPTKELEQICISKNVIFWSFDRKNYAKANWWKKTASAGIGEMITIRTANTLKKIVGM